MHRFLFLLLFPIIQLRAQDPKQDVGRLPIQAGVQIDSPGLFLPWGKTRAEVPVMPMSRVRVSKKNFEVVQMDSIGIFGGFADSAFFQFLRLGTRMSKVKMGTVFYRVIFFANEHLAAYFRAEFERLFGTPLVSVRKKKFEYAWNTKNFFILIAKKKRAAPPGMIWVSIQLRQYPPVIPGSPQY